MRLINEDQWELVWGTPDTLHVVRPATDKPVYFETRDGQFGRTYMWRLGPFAGSLWVAHDDR